MCLYTMFGCLCECVCARAIYIYATHLKLVKVRSVPTRKIHHGIPQHELARDDEVTSGGYTHCIHGALRDVIFGGCSQWSRP
jgi:hypothetical protein